MEEQIQNTLEKKSNKLWWILGVIIIILAFIFFINWFVGFLNGSEDLEKDNRTFINLKDLEKEEDLGFSSQEKIKEVEEDWCIIGENWDYEFVENSREWIIQEVRYYNSDIVCYAEKEGSKINYYFKKNNEQVFVLKEDSTRRIKLSELN